MPGFPTHMWRKAVLALPIPHAQKVVLIALAEYADYQTGRDAWPGRANLMSDCRVGKGTVDRALNAGRKHGVIVQVAPGHKGANPVFHLVRQSAPERTQSAPAVGRNRAPKRPTTDTQSAPLVGRLPTPIPTPNERSEAAPTGTDEVGPDLTSVPPVSSVLERSDFSSTPRSSSPNAPLGNDGEPADLDAWRDALRRRHEPRETGSWRKALGLSEHEDPWAQDEPKPEDGARRCPCDCPMCVHQNKIHDGSHRPHACSFAPVA